MLINVRRELLLDVDEKQKALRAIEAERGSAGRDRGRVHAHQATMTGAADTGPSTASRWVVSCHAIICGVSAAKQPTAATPARLPVSRNRSCSVGEHAALQQAFAEIDLVADRILAIDFHFHGLGRSTAVQADHRVPARLVGRGQIFDETRYLDALFVRDVRSRRQYLGEATRRRGIVVFVGTWQRHDHAAGHMVRESMHVIDLRRHQQLADVREHGIRRHRTAGLLRAIHRCCHPARIETLDDLDQVDHGIAHPVRALEIDAVGFGHQRAGPDEEITEARTRRDARLSMLRCVVVENLAGAMPLAGAENAFPWNEYAVEHADTGRLSILAAEFRRRLAGPAGWTRNDRQPGGVDRHGAADGEIGVVPAHVAARHDEQFVNVWRRRDDGLGTGNDDAVGTTLDNMQVRVRIRLARRAEGPVAFGVGHRNPERQVIGVDVGQVRFQPRVILGPCIGIDALRAVMQGGERVAAEITLRASCFLA